MMPLAPGLLSTTMVPNLGRSSSERTRATVSDALPALNGTTILTGWAG